MARRADMTIEQLTEKLKRKSNVSVRSIHTATPLLLALHSGDAFEKGLAASLGGARVHITHDQHATVFHITVTDSPKKTRTPAQCKSEKEK